VSPAYDLPCSLIAVINEDYSVNFCGPEPNVTECLSDTTDSPTPVPAPTTAAPVVPITTANYTMLYHVNNIPDPKWTWLSSLINATIGLSDALDDDGRSFTLFAPSDAAFGVLNQSEYLDTLLLDTWTPHRQCLVASHLLTQDLRPDMITAGLEVTTIYGSQVTMGVDPLTVNDIPIDIFQGVSNGWLYLLEQQPILPDCIADTMYSFVKRFSSFNTVSEIIDGLLLQEEFTTMTPLTLFAPIDGAFRDLSADLIAYLNSDAEVLKQIILGHAISGDQPIYLLDSGDFGTYTTLGNTNLTISATDTNFVVNGDTAIFGGQLVRNGILHVLDKVIIPEGFSIPTSSPSGAASASPTAAAPVAGTPITPGPVNVTTAPAMPTDALTPAPAMPTDALTPAPVAASTTTAPSVTSATATTTAPTSSGVMVQQETIAFNFMVAAAAALLMLML